jgi:hypothetical protein
VRRRDLSLFTLLSPLFFFPLPPLIKAL